MQDNNITTDTDSVSAPSWDSSQLHLRAWLDDVAAWLPAQHSNYSSPIEFGYVLTSQGSVAACNLEHALHCRSRLLSAHSFDSPSPRNPVFTMQGSIAPSNLQSTIRRFGRFCPCVHSCIRYRLRFAALTADEFKRYIIAPELIDATDRKMMTAILQTITCQGSRSPDLHARLQWQRQRSVAYSSE
eukprot:2225184-Pleurochrysis_carterae.AAC.3